MFKAVIIHAIKLIDYLCRDENSIHVTLDVHAVFAIEEGIRPAFVEEPVVAISEIIGELI